MIISRAEIQSVISAYRTSSKRKSSSVLLPADATPDTFEASETLLGLTDEMKQPYYRSDLVYDLKRRIAEGQYYVASDEIVEKLLGRLVAENLAEV